MHLLIEKTIKEATEYFHNFFIHEYTKNTYLHSVDPAVKLIGTLVFILLSITTFNPERVLLTVLAVYFLAFNVRISLRLLVKRSSLFTIFSFIIVLPVSIYERNLEYALIFPLRVFSSISALQLFILTTKFNEAMYALKRLRVPKIMLDIVWLTYRYTVVMFRDLLDIMLAREARRMRKGSHLEMFRVGGKSLGLFFLRSFEKAEMIELAMASRGREVVYSGSYDRGYFYLVYVLAITGWWVML
ncbi:MAG: cobalt ECF transporter T component CbiQ [Archaeoglobi archaeon]|nr:cobalt ECF transporter T component CbiQ [Archaeoglobi archaeon]